ncbi:MAG: YIP1 family protein [Candidatus Eiseniibacteriota bacterium]
MSQSVAAPAGAPGAAKGLAIVPMLFSSPSSAFRRLGEDPQWLGQFVLCTVLVLVATWIRMPQDLAYQYDVTEATIERMGVPEEDRAAALAGIPDPENLSQVQAALHIAMVTVTLAALGFLGALVLWVIAKLFGPQPSYRRALSTYWTANLAAGFGYLILAVVVRAADTIEVSLGPAALVPGLTWGSLPHLFLEVFAVFSLVTLWFLALGSRFVFGAPGGAGWAIGGTFWAVTSFVSLVVSAVGSWAAGRL